MFAQDIGTDLTEGRLVELAEICALDAITDDERQAIDEYVRKAPEAERAAFLERVRTARETLAVTFTVEEEPPAGLLDRILAELPAQAAPQNPDAPPLRGGSGDEAPKAGAGSATATADVGHSAVDLAAARNRRHARRRLSGPRAWLAAAAAAVVLAIGGVGIGSYVASQNDPVNQVLQARDVREATVPVAGGGTATVAVAASRDSAVVRMNDVPAPPAGKVYQMWLIPRDGSAPVSQGLLDAAALSRPAVVNGISGADSLGITVEPEGGSRQPTLPTVAAAKLGA